MSSEVKGLDQAPLTAGVRESWLLLLLASSCLTRTFLGPKPRPAAPPISCKVPRGPWYLQGRILGRSLERQDWQEALAVLRVARY